MGRFMAEIERQTWGVRKVGDYQGNVVVDDGGLWTL